MEPLEYEAALPGNVAKANEVVDGTDVTFTRPSRSFRQRLVMVSALDGGGESHGKVVPVAENTVAVCSESMAIGVGAAARELCAQEPSVFDNVIGPDAIVCEEVDLIVVQPREVTFIGAEAAGGVGKAGCDD